MAIDQGLFYRTLGENLRKVRGAKKIKQGPLAGAVGLSRTSITNIERGRQRVDVELLVRLATTLGVAVNELVPSMRSSKQKALPRKARQLDPKARAWVQRIIEVDGGVEVTNGSKIQSRTTKGT